MKFVAVNNVEAGLDKEKRGVTRRDAFMIAKVWNKLAPAH
jgi:hypothetical protein